MFKLLKSKKDKKYKVYFTKRGDRYVNVKELLEDCSVRKLIKEMARIKYRNNCI